jgi:putative transcriptional regulator
LGDNSWLTVEADTRLIFETPVAERYTQALKLLGLEPWMLAPDAGHA